MHQSFTDFLGAYDDRHPRLMSYCPTNDFGTWRRQLLAKIQELMGLVPDRVEPVVTIRESVERPDHIRHRLEIEVSAITRLPAYLLIPRGMGTEERRPGVIVMHGHGKHGMDQMCGVRVSDKPDAAERCYGLMAVRAGFVVLTPCWWGWDERDGHLPLVGDRDKCNAIQNAAAMHGLNVLALHMQDATAALDVLAQRPEVDANRIGCVGHSYGGRLTMWFTLLDQRITAAVAGGCMNTFRERSLNLGSCGIQYPFGILRWADVQDIMCLIAPRPLQLQAGEQDPLIHVADRDMIRRTVADAYHRCNATTCFEYHQQPGGHILKWPPAEKFLRRHLAHDDGIA